ncbi:hypothetical protein E2C01_060925 [Portunus trituberculatus]|uniref:Uncharacterized protein n=1 Tax=Portunus trituberculatus TaxID=210409 RepID=A0A5B7H6R9_PORTR|nr:hypothetical protein [Portunus trituberculatus]
MLQQELGDSDNRVVAHGDSNDVSCKTINKHDDALFSIMYRKRSHHVHSYSLPLLKCSDTTFRSGPQPVSNQSPLDTHGIQK